MHNRQAKLSVIRAISYPILHTPLSQLPAECLLRSLAEMRQCDVEMLGWLCAKVDPAEDQNQSQGADASIHALDSP
jgi:hypothetical protein